MEIALVRAAFLHVYVDQLREIGVPFERDIAKSGLSPWVLEQPDAYVSIFRGLEWLATCSRDMELADFGFLAARRQSLAPLSRPLQRAVHDAPTGYAGLLAFHRHASHEDNALSIRLQPEGNQIGVISKMDGFAGHTIDHPKRSRAILVPRRDDFRLSASALGTGTGRVPENAHPDRSAPHVDYNLQ